MVKKQQSYIKPDFNNYKVAVIREELVIITKDYNEAILLNQVIYWSTKCKDSIEFELFERDKLELILAGKILIKDLLSSKTDKESYGWIYKSACEFQDETLMINLSLSTISRKLKSLCEKNLIEKRRNQRVKYDRTYQYRVNLSYLLLLLSKYKVDIDFLPYRLINKYKELSLQISKMDEFKMIDCFNKIDETKHSDILKSHDDDSKNHSDDSENHDDDSKNHDDDSKNHDDDSKNHDDDSKNHSDDSKNHSDNTKNSNDNSKNHSDKAIPEINTETTEITNLEKEKVKELTNYLRNAFLNNYKLDKKKYDTWIETLSKSIKNNNLFLSCNVDMQYDFVNSNYLSEIEKICKEFDKTLNVKLLNHKN